MRHCLSYRAGSGQFFTGSGSSSNRKVGFHLFSLIFNNTQPPSLERILFLKDLFFNESLNKCSSECLTKFLFHLSWSRSRCWTFKPAPAPAPQHCSPMVALVAVPVRQVGKAVAQADDGIEPALGNDSAEVGHQAQPVRLLDHPAERYSVNFNVYVVNRILFVSILTYRRLAPCVAPIWSCGPPSASCPKRPMRSPRTPFPIIASISFIVINLKKIKKISTEPYGEFVLPSCNPDCNFKMF